MPKIIMHVDLDAFYAAVEEREHPEYTGKPVVVGADPKGGKGRGVVSTANYEARKFGIHSAMPISQAYRLCPNAFFVQPDMHLYVAVSHNVMQILRAFGDSFEQVSIDEAYLDVTEAVRKYGSSEAMAHAIKKEIMEKEKLSCSVGVASNKLIAKIASDFKKPNGLTIVEPGLEKEFIAPLPVRKLLYVGPKTEERLKSLGINTVAELASVDRGKLVQLFGKFGNYLHDASNGMGDDVVLEDYEIKSVNRNYTFEEDTKDAARIEEVIDVMADDVAQVLAEEKFLCKTIGIRVRFEDFETFTRAKTIESPVKDAAVLKEVARKLLQPFYSDKRLIRQVGLRVSTLESVDNAQKRVNDYR